MAYAAILVESGMYSDDTTIISSFLNSTQLLNPVGHTLSSSLIVDNIPGTLESCLPLVLLPSPSSSYLFMYLWTPKLTYFLGNLEL